MTTLVTQISVNASTSITSDQIYANYLHGDGSNISNVSVANATYANIAGVAESVAGSNVVGAVGNATLAHVATFATTANAVAAANVFGTVANSAYAINSNYAAYAGNVTVASQPNITSVGTLTGLTVGGNATANYFIGNGSQLTGITSTYGNSNVASFLAVGTNTQNIVTTGNIQGGFLFGDGGFISNISGAGGDYGDSNVVTLLSAYGSNSISTTGNVTAGHLKGEGGNISNIQGANVSGAVATALFSNSSDSANNALIAGVANSVDGGNVVGAVFQSFQSVRSATSNSVNGSNVVGAVNSATYSTIVIGGAQPNITSLGNLSELVVDGNVSANYYTGDGSLLTNLPGSTGIANGTSNVKITTSGGPITSYVDGNIMMTLSTTKTAIGPSAGLTDQGQYSVAIGSGAGQTTQLDYSVAIGYNAGNDNQDQYAVAMGIYAGETNQGTESVAIGGNAGSSDQGDAAIGIGPFAGGTSQGANAVAVGSRAGGAAQGANAVSVGHFAGASNQGANSIAIGGNAAPTNQAANSIVINATGATLDNTTADTLKIAPIRNDVSNIANVLYYNTTTKEVTYAPAGGGTFIASGTSNIGFSAANGNIVGFINSLPALTISTANNIAIGANAGLTSQSDGSIAIGTNAGANAQGGNAIAIGPNAGGNTPGFQGANSIAIGRGAGYTSQGANAIAFGRGAGQELQGANSVIIGHTAGGFNAGDGAVVIGRGTGNNIGANSISIGKLASANAQVAGSIVIGAGAPAISATNVGAYVSPVRNDTGNVTNTMYYNAATREVTYAATGGTQLAKFFSGLSVSGSTQVIPQNTDTTVIYASTSDLNSWYNATTGVLTPTTNGVYIFTINVDWAVGAGTNPIRLSIQKNGVSAFASVYMPVNTVGVQTQVLQCTIAMNGTTDNVRAVVNTGTSGATQTITGGLFQAILL